MNPNLSYLGILSNAESDQVMVFSSSKVSSVDASKWVGELVKEFGGKSGGKSSLAQGSFQIPSGQDQRLLLETLQNKARAFITAD
jgi:alanyl-tRNA synthetase